MFIFSFYDSKLYKVSTNAIVIEHFCHENDTLHLFIFSLWFVIQKSFLHSFEEDPQYVTETLGNN